MYKLTNLKKKFASVRNLKKKISVLKKQKI